MKVQAAIQGFLMDWELRQRSPNTLRLYRSCLAVLARWLEGQGITGRGRRHDRAPARVHPAHPAAPCGLRSPAQASSCGWAQARQRRRSSRTSRRSRSGAAGWWRRRSWSAIPRLRLQKPTGAKRVKVTLTDAHLNALFGACDLNHPLGFRDYTLMLVLLDTGIRVAELCGLTLDEPARGLPGDLRQGQQGARGRRQPNHCQVPLEVRASTPLCGG